MWYTTRPELCKMSTEDQAGGWRALEHDRTLMGRTKAPFDSFFISLSLYFLKQRNRARLRQLHYLNGRQSRVLIDFVTDAEFHSGLGMRMTKS